MSQERLLSVLRAPHISEKATNNAEKSNTVVLKVALDANKAEIAAAVAQLFEVKVDVRDVQGIDPVSLIAFDKVIVTVDAVKQIEEILA